MKLFLRYLPTSRERRRQRLIIELIFLFHAVFFFLALYFIPELKDAFIQLLFSLFP